MIEIEDISYVEVTDSTSFRCTFKKSAYQIIFDRSLPGDLTEAQIAAEMQDEYDKWIERNNIP
jgi:hypothetical protein